MITGVGRKRSSQNSSVIKQLSGELFASPFVKSTNSDLLYQQNYQKRTEKNKLENRNKHRLHGIFIYFKYSLLLENVSNAKPLQNRQHTKWAKKAGPETHDHNSVKS